MEKIPKNIMPGEQGVKIKNLPEQVERQPEFSEAKEGFRATLGFDFVFVTQQDGTKRCYCVEINGGRTGILGMEEIPNDQINPNIKQFARIRMHHNEKYFKKVEIANDVAAELNASEEAKRKIKQFMNRSISNEPMFTHAEKNSFFIENIATNKKLQQTYIPDDNKPREYTVGANPESRTGYWICKPIHGQNGDDIIILSNKEFQQHVIDENADTRAFVAQEWLSSAGAEHAPEGLHSAPASLRYLVDFRYLADGTIDEMFKTGYQRVSEYEPIPLEELSVVERGLMYVVNKSRGAYSVAASEEEMRLAKELAEKIIHNLATGYGY